MYEGWVGDDYLVLFSESEIAAANDRYGFEKLLPGFRVLGLRGWDDFIVQDSAGKCFSIPTVPVDPRYLESFRIPDPKTEVAPDLRFVGKIKWYTKPLAFGGDPNIGENCVWVTHEQHSQLVSLWNQRYRKFSGDTSL